MVVPPGVLVRGEKQPNLAPLAWNSTRGGARGAGLSQVALAKLVVATLDSGVLKTTAKTYRAAT